MSGHSKWATIKHKKAKEDAKRGQVFTKIIKEITVAAKQGGGDPNGNPRLRTLLEKAKEANMPADNVTRAIKKGTGELPGVAYESYTYEGYGPGKIALIVEVLTDNKNRAIADLRHFFSRHGGILAEGGAVNWMFERMGVIEANGNKQITEDKLLEKLLDYDVKDIYQDDDGIFTITCNPRALDEVKKAVEEAGLKVTSAETELVSSHQVKLTDGDEQKAYDFLSALQDLDDVQNVYTNLG
ncbi:YebC/PmpR family DNA-binding transcriptional regulator [Candidatus Dependentiae bacterium]|nr:YebC/PmpR family DNA-binding transcriptional regulator [Candidatus Dependentiae bacterium]